jgi:hypothetical protein
MMKILRNKFWGPKKIIRLLKSPTSILTLILLCSCSNSSENKIEETQADSVIIGNTEQPGSSSSFKSEEEVNSTTEIRFNELSITINRLIISDQNITTQQIKEDTVTIHAEVGEIIDGQLISLDSDQLTGLSIEQRYETSVTIMDEGPHCDLTDWKHSYSDWKQLEKNGHGQFICNKYPPGETDIFPEVSIDELKQKVKEHCGDEWSKHVEKIQKVTEYPSGVGISRQYLKVTGKRKDNEQTVIKVIIIETPMGC